jgi:hypothetical protein
MSSLTKTLLLTAVAGATLAPAAHAETILSAEQAPTRVAAWNGTVMWSQKDPATGRYRLVRSVDGGAPTVVPVPQRPEPFDIDLGTNRSGGTYAVYTRDGDIYRLRVATGEETEIDKLSSPQAAERDPTIQRGEIAFIRREGGFDQLRIGNTTSGSTGSRLLVKRRSISGAELGISHVAYYVNESRTEGRLLHVHVRNISTGRDHVVYRASSGALSMANVTRPTLQEDLGGFVWARTNVGSGQGNRLVRYRLRGSKLSYAQGSPRWSSTAWASAQLGAATSSTLAGAETPNACEDAGVQYCRVALTGPVSFTLRP